MKVFLRILPILTIILIVAACNASSDEKPPTEIRVITGEPEVAQLQSTIHAMETQQAVVATSPTVEATIRPSSENEGVIIGGNAVVFAEPAIDATEVGILQENAVVSILDESEPNRIGVVFYEVENETLTGWVASTQIRLQEPELAASETSEEVAVVVSPRASDTSAVRPSQTPTPLPSATMTATLAPTITPTTLPVGFPTPQIYSVVLVEQLFERGRMIWFQPVREIWVLEGEGIDPREGTWTCFIDEFVDGMAERSSEFDPPAGVTTFSRIEGAVPSQPIRGFGRVWRENDDIREALGWALLPETLYTTRYQYNAGGEVEDGEYTPGAGEIVIESLFQETIVLHEDRFQIPCTEGKSGTWEIR